jgi:hypothetical protein
MAQWRAGWYANDRSNDDRVPSAERIVPEIQHIEVGDRMPTGPAGGFAVE